MVKLFEFRFWSNSNTWKWTKIKTEIVNDHGTLNDLRISQLFVNSKQLRCAFIQTKNEEQNTYCPVFGHLRRIPGFISAKDLPVSVSLWFLLIFVTASSEMIRFVINANEIVKMTTLIAPYHAVIRIVWLTVEGRWQTV